MEKSRLKPKERMRKEGSGIVRPAQHSLQTIVNLKERQNDLPLRIMFDHAFNVIHPGKKVYTTYSEVLRRKYSIHPSALFILAERESVRDESFIGRR